MPADIPFRNSRRTIRSWQKSKIFKMPNEQEKPPPSAFQHKSPQSILPIPKPPQGREVQFAPLRELGGHSHHGIKQRAAAYVFATDKEDQVLGIASRDTRTREYNKMSAQSSQGKGGRVAKPSITPGRMTVPSMQDSDYKMCWVRSHKARHWNKAQWFPPSQPPGSVQGKWGVFLQSLGGFDPRFWDF